MFNWSGLETGWQEAYFLSCQKPDGSATEIIPVAVSISEERLFASNSEEGGFVNFYEKNPDGIWTFVDTLYPEAEGDWQYAYQDPVSFGDTIVTHASYGGWSTGTYYRGTMYFRKQPEGDWKYVGFEESGHDDTFKAGDYLLRAYYPFYHLIETRTQYLELIDPTQPMGENRISYGPFDYGFFPISVTEDWISFFFEPSPENWVERGAIAIVPILDGEIHPKPALLVPTDILEYASIAALSAIDGTHLVFPSMMANGKGIMESLDLSTIPHPKFPNISFAKWTALGELQEGTLKLPIQFRESAKGTHITKVLFSYDQVNWFEVPEDEVIRSIIDEDVDGDGATNIVRIELPITRNDREVMYRLNEIPLKSGGGLGEE